MLDRLYEGKRHLFEAWPELIQAAEHVLDLDETKRSRTLIRFGSGAGTQAQVRWLVEHSFSAPPSSCHFCVRDGNA